MAHKVMSARLQLTAAFAALFIVTCAGRMLKQAATELEFESETTILTDVEGGVAPLAARIENAQERNELTLRLIEAEAECKAQNKSNAECEEVTRLQEEAAEEVEEPEDVEAPCYQSIIGSYVFGTLCLLPPDSTADGKYKSVEAEDGAK
jgi:hypothetical protein